jgi:ketosteroid isomerase-like protein
MSEPSNIKLIGDLYAAFGRGDVAFITSHLTDDVRWMSYIEPIVPWGGDFSGKTKVPRFFEAIYQNADTESFTPTEYVAQGDTVVSLGGYVCRVRATGKKSSTTWAFIWKFREGKVCSYEQYHDPALAEAFR